MTKSTTPKMKSVDLTAALAAADVIDDDEQLVESTPESESAAAERIAEYETAKAEHAALKQWKLDGEKGDRPATPTLDAMNERMAAAGMAAGSAGSTRRRSSSTREPKRAPAMPDNDVLAAVREMFDADLFVTQTAVSTALNARGARMRAIRPAYKTVAAERRDEIEKARKQRAKSKRSTKSETPASSTSTVDVTAAIVDALNGDDSALTEIVEQTERTKPNVTTASRRAVAKAKSATKSTTKSAPAKSTARKSTAKSTSSTSTSAKPAAKRTTKPAAKQVTPNLKSTTKRSRKAS